MTQLPFPGQPSAPSPPAVYPPPHPDPSHGLYSVAATGPPRYGSRANSVEGGGAGFDAGSLGRPGGAPAAQAYAEYPVGAGAQPAYPITGSAHAHSPSTSTAPSYAPSSAAVSVPAQPPIPPPRRAATLPVAPPAIVPVQAPVPPPADAALAGFHRSLVAYYWHYAQQGYVAPLTAVDGTVERVQQERARAEAVDWARTCGIAVVDPTAPPLDAGISGGAPAEFAAAHRARALSRPLPHAPTGVVAPQTAALPSTSAGRPLPSPAIPRAPASAPPSSDAALPPAARSPLPPTPLSSSQLDRSTSLPGFGSSPATTVLSPRNDATSAHAAHDAHAQPSKRPLPAPPVAQLVGALDGMRIATSSSAVPANEQAGAPSLPALPSISLSEQQSDVPEKPPIPTFSFGDCDDDDPPASAPAVPSFSFDEADVVRVVAPPSAAPSRRSAPLHPRHDPAHPSHKLYHPTSVLPSSAASASSPSALPEAGTLACTACRSLIFGRVLVALGREWHPDCFRCAEKGCGAKLEVMEFEGTPEDWDAGGEAEEEGEGLRGKAWCMVHFEERFALECYHCRTPIASADYLPITDALLPPRESYRHPSTRFYHPLHFFCSGCGDPFVDPVSYELLPASATSALAELEARPYVPREGHPYCDACDLRMWRPKCVGCRKGLREEDGFLEVEGGKWHEGCFQCSMCTKPLSGIYLLRRSPSSLSGVDVLADGDDEVDELPFCAECYDIKAKEEAEAAVVAGRGA